MNYPIKENIQHCDNCYVLGVLTNVDKINCKVCQNSDFHQFRLLRNCRYCSSTAITISPENICQPCFYYSTEKYSNKSRKQEVKTESQKQKHVSERSKKRKNPQQTSRKN